MFFASVLRSLRLSSPSAKGVGRRTARKRPAGYSLCLEQLEDRTVMSTGLSTQAAVGWVAKPDYVLAQAKAWLKRLEKQQK